MIFNLYGIFMSDSYLSNRNSIRQKMRSLRNSINAKQQQKITKLLIKKLVSYLPIIQAKKIAIFLSIDGEPNTKPLIKVLLEENKQIFLPVIKSYVENDLIFINYTPKTPLILNTFGILEPIINKDNILNLSDLDVMLVPLVAFDRKGQRLGMGRGYYDRTLQNWQKYNFLPIGIAHDFQLVEKLPTAKWDIPLPIIITPSHIWQW
ncbi:predicted ligase [Candidatus Ishikawaella capsulata Mpkobe]|uniref:5-formyltetrahydrofolate cyclo-ligase n=2 Tax=Candidatus Ishikawella capsulata TaxID=168169 RepID=C5WCF5_9ENTR|nr:predicted ligase [Candidatus Ishikawaella capsulata Mpkobe]